ncbi:hypothetical protein AGIG_G5083 [Arapaima gigas]
MSHMMWLYQQRGKQPTQLFCNRSRDVGHLSSPARDSEGPALLCVRKRRFAARKEEQEDKPLYTRFSPYQMGSQRAAGHHRGFGDLLDISFLLQTSSPDTMQVQGPPVWILVLACVTLSGCPTSVAQHYSRLPVNVTQEPGKTVTFVCGVSPSNTTLNFTLYDSHVVSTLSCPAGSPSQPSQVISGRCESNAQEVWGVWSLSYTVSGKNGTYVMCQGTHLPPVYSFLYIQESKSYFAILVGCVMGGFFGFIVIFGLGFIALKRSERLQRCFKGKTPQDDITTIVEENYKSL